MYKYVIEFLATSFLLFVIIATGNPIYIGIAHTISVFLAKPISGGHVSPLVSIMMVLTNKFPPDELVPYIITHVLAALFVVLIYKQINL